MKYHGYRVQEEIMCEICGEPAVDIHHIFERSICAKHGIDRDCIDNLIALCRKDHENSDLKARLKIELFDKLKEIQDD